MVGEVGWLSPQPGPVVLAISLAPTLLGRSLVVMNCWHNCPVFSHIVRLLQDLECVSHLTALVFLVEVTGSWREEEEYRGGGSSGRQTRPRDFATEEL